MMSCYFLYSDIKSRIQIYEMKVKKYRLDVCEDIYHIYE